MKTYRMIYGVNIWDIIDDIQLIGLEIKGMSANSITIAESAGFTISMIDEIMEKRGFI